MAQFNEWQNVLRGIALAASLAIAVFAIMFLITLQLQSLSTYYPNTTWLSALVLIGSLLVYFIEASQLVYIIPLIVVLLRQRRFALMKGVIIGAVMVALVNFGCFLLSVTQFR